MSIQRIAQPYVVFWPYNEGKTAEVRNWCLEQILNPYVVFSATSDENYLIELSAPVHEKMAPTAIFMFECPRDAMLFKLTWGGN